MDKLELIDKLKKKGMDCQLENHIPMVRTEDKSFTMNKLRVFVSDLGYDGSFGLRVGGAKFERGTQEEAEAENAEAESADAETVTETENVSGADIKSVTTAESAKNADQAEHTENVAAATAEDAIEDVAGMLHESEDGQISFF